MIIILSIVLVLSIAFSIYIYLEGKKNKKAIFEIVAPELAEQRKAILDIMKKL